MTNHNNSDWSWLIDLIFPTCSCSIVELALELVWELIKFILSALI